jgi:MoxR-like ATPase
MDPSLKSNEGTGKANRRLGSLMRHITLKDPNQILRYSVVNGDEISDVTSRDDYTSVTLGDVTIAVETPKRPELVPRLGTADLYGYELPLPELLNHLQWMMKKVQLGQDIFLIGPPGPVRRWLAFRFCQLIKREIEYQSLTSDTTESDLKQRREIRDKTIHYVDQAAVRAALHGRILILDGIEKCERNVLPILNNLLENREMHLEDGRFLVSPKRYEYLSKVNSAEELARLRLVPVHPKFQVIALGLPIPKFEGNALDPPLRSRFQARNVSPLSEQTQLSLIKTKFPSLPMDLLAQIVTFAESLQRVQLSDEGALLPRLLQLPATALVDFVRFFDRFPLASKLATLVKVYPYFVKSNEAEKKAIEASLTSVGFLKRNQAISGPKNSPQNFQNVNPDLGAKVESDLNRDPEDVNLTQMKERALQHILYDPSYRIHSVTPLEGKDGEWKVTFSAQTFIDGSSPSTKFVDINMFGGSIQNLKVKQHHPYVETESARQLLVGLLQDHSLDHDMCVIGEQGSGKTQLVAQFAELLHYNIRTMQMYKDMTSRDFLQKRTTNARGDTIWQTSPLVEAAIHGDLVVLDGIHRLAPGTLCVLQQLLHDREITLLDGSRLVRRPTLEHLMRSSGLSATQLMDQGVKVVHPAFRIIAIANPPDRQKPWLTSEIVSMFHFHMLSAISLQHKFEIAQALFPKLRGLFTSANLETQRRKIYLEREEIQHAPQGSKIHQNSNSGSFSLANQGSNDAKLKEAAGKLLLFASSLSELRNQKMDTDESGTSDSDIPIFSLRQLIRTCQRIVAFPSDLAKVVENVLLYKFFPLVLRESVGNVLLNSGIAPKQSVPVHGASFASTTASSSQSTSPSSSLSLARGSTELDSNKAELKMVVTENAVSIGSVVVPRHTPQNPALVPRITYFEIPAHAMLIQDMMKDWILGEHMLLIGNQGVGKNVLVDRMLEVLRLEREYIQLHRDTTVQTLTLAPSIVNGVVVWEDSALVRAVKFGRVLVIDEADKAPLEVVCILKGLIEDSEMLLADGRRIVALQDSLSLKTHQTSKPTNIQFSKEKGNLIPIHPGFRMIVLANRPGFPFLGNNFFRECGDCFSVHVVDNPDRDSELRLLRSYGPNVDIDILDRLVNLFGDLREMVDQGQLTYPYSLRELVNIVKHMEAFPGDSLLQGIDNVFHFDQYDTVIREHLTGIFQRHGLPVGGYFDFSVKLASEVALPSSLPSERWAVNHARPLMQSQNGTLAAVTVLPLTPKGEWKSPTGTLNASFKLRKPPTGRLKTFREEKVSFVVESNGTLEGATAGLDGTIFILTSKPLQLIAYSPKTAFRTFRIIRLSDHLQTHHARYSSDRGVSLMPTSITTLKNGKIVVFIATYHMLLVVDPETDTVTPFELPSSTAYFSVFGRRAYITESVSQTLQRTPSEYSSSSVRLVMNDTLASSEGIVVIPRLRGSDFFWLDFLTGKVGHSILPIQMQIIALNPLSRTIWLLTGHNNTRMFIKFDSDRLERYDIVETVQSVPNDFKHGALNQHTFYSLNSKNSTLLNHELTHLQSSEKSLLSLANSRTSGIDSTMVSSVLRDAEDLKTTIHTIYLERNELLVNLCFSPGQDMSVEAVRQRASTPSSSNAKSLVSQEEAQMVFEVVDLTNNMVRVVPIPVAGNERVSPHSAVQIANSSIGYVPKVVRLVSMTTMATGEILVLGEDGRVAIFEFDSKKLQSQLQQWNRIVGSLPQANLPKKQELRMVFEYNDGKRASGNPKFGEFDGKHHRGGATFAGGQGGGDTAGIGGTGGPARLDLGHGHVFQVSDEVKQQVDRKVLDASRAMAKQALAEKLSAIEMSDFDSGRYDAMMNEMKAEIRQLRSILESAAAKGKERTWLKLKTSGELDDNRLVDGITGEKAVYKARGKQKPMDGSPQEKPKRLRFVMDVSGSMARFNGTDRRLERLLQCTLMIMESLKGFEHKYSYSIVGHSGDSPEIDFVDYGKPPKNKKERLDILDKMTAHSAHCSSGDYTVKATELAIRNVTKEDGDEYFVFVFSDANLGRYGIKPSAIKEELLRDRRVGAYILFIASAGDDAHKIRTELPLGKAHVCLDTASLPVTFKQIFASNIGNTD